MVFFSRLRAERAANRDLGNGVWRRAHDRFNRSLDRVFQVIEGIEDDRLHNEFVARANDLAELLPVVREICREAQALTPSEDEQIPQRTARIHRALTKSANDLATTAQAMAMLRIQAEAGGADMLFAVDNRARIVTEEVSQAQRLLRELFD